MVAVLIDRTELQRTVDIQIYRSRIARHNDTLVGTGCGVDDFTGEQTRLKIAKDVVCFNKGDEQ